MTTEELHAEVLHRQGHIVIFRLYPFDGDILPADRCFNEAGDLFVPWRVLGPATRQDYFAQLRLMESLDGIARIDMLPGNYYRVIPCD